MVTSSLAFRLRHLAFAPRHSACHSPSNLGLVPCTWALNLANLLASLLVTSRPFCTLESLSVCVCVGFYNSDAQVIPQTNVIRASGGRGQALAVFKDPDGNARQRLGAAGLMHLPKAPVSYLPCRKGLRDYPWLMCRKWGL